MTQAFPPRRPLLGGRLVLALALGLFGSVGLLAARAQDDGAPKKDAPSTPKDDSKGKTKPDDAPTKDEAKTKSKSDEAPAEAAKDAKDEEADKPPIVPLQAEPEAPDRWEDPRSADALVNEFPELNKALTSPPSDKALVDQLARGQGQMDLGAIDRFVRTRVADLTKRSNIKALMDPLAKGADAKALEKAADDLIKPLMIPSAGANQGFRREYVKKLVEVFQPIWAGHLHSRTMAMIVLSRSGEVAAMPTFTEQLNNPDQLAVVKLLASVGISNVALNGRREVEDGAALPAAKALNDFLRREPDIFWPAQFRAVEALGSLRMATDKPLLGKAEFAETLLLAAADPKAAPTVRAWSAWALGMMRVPSSVKNYNYALVADVLGSLTADIGTKIAKLPDDAQSKMFQKSDLLVQIHLGISGDPDARGSGLVHANHPSAGTALPHVGEVEKRVRNVAKLALELANSSKGESMKTRRTALLAACDDLRTFVAKPLPNGRALFAGSEPLPTPEAPKVAGARP